MEALKRVGAQGCEDRGWDELSDLPSDAYAFDAATDATSNVQASTPAQRATSAHPVDLTTPPLRDPIPAKDLP